ncbi:MAG: hypothetical protein C4293_05445 [Nitrospiraceae bacterium]
MQNLQVKIILRTRKKSLQLYVVEVTSKNLFAQGHGICDYQSSEMRPFLLIEVLNEAHYV